MDMNSSAKIHEQALRILHSPKTRLKMSDTSPNSVICRGGPCADKGARRGAEGALWLVWSS